jgi:hypothetical protein
MPIDTSGNLRRAHPARVLVVRNGDDPDSVAVAADYVARRHVPPAQVVTVSAPTGNGIGAAAFATMSAAIRSALAALPWVNFVVMARTPSQIADGPRAGYSADSVLMGDCLPAGTPRFNSLNVATGQYNSGNPAVRLGNLPPKRYTRQRGGGLAPLPPLVCRLDGFTPADASALLTRSLLASATASLAPVCQYGSSGGAGDDTYIRTGTSGLIAALAPYVAQGLPLRKENNDGTGTPGNLGVPGSSGWFYGDRPADGTPLLGLVGLGNQYGLFSSGGPDSNAYKQALAPGGIVWAVESGSGGDLRTAQAIPPAGQYPAAQWARQGAAVIVATTSEPTTIGFPRADLVFLRYLQGHTAAEAVYYALGTLDWKTVVLCDPLCAPFARRGS